MTKKTPSKLSNKAMILKPKGRHLTTTNIVRIAVALIGLIGVLVGVYLQFVLKPGAQNQYVGRVIDSKSQQPIAGAKVTLDLQDVPPIVYTDSEGIYRFKVVIRSEISGQVRVDAQNYQTYTRNITISPDVKTIEDIRLILLESTKTTTETLIPAPTANPTLMSMLTPNPEFTPQFRTIDGVEQNWVPEGSFVAGDTSGFGYDDERPFHIVYTDGFWIDRTSVTNSEYASCPDSICTPPQKLNSHVRPVYYGIPEYGNYPVINIIWQQASDYCAWRSGRLPTEAEFEKAAGWNPVTGLTLIYPWGDLAPTDDFANFNGIDRDTKPVGSYPKGMSPTGAYDMAGNVWEWVSDWYSATYYADNHEWHNPTGAQNGIYKVIKGGSWYDSNTSWLRVSNRGGITPPDKVANEFGFRCVFGK